MEFTFVISQILVGIAMITDFAGFQFKDRKKTVILFAISCILISSHYFLLGKTSAGLIVSISAIRFITSYFTTNKKVLLLFITINIIALFSTFYEAIDIIFYLGITLGIIGSFQDQKHNKIMRVLMMCGTSLVIIYNILIFSPMAIITESVFLASNLIGYFRFYFKKTK